MADISKEIKDFKDAVYGEEVRGSMISLAEKVNKEGEKALENVEKQVTAIKETEKRANEVLEKAEKAIGRADSTSDKANTVLEGAEEKAKEAADSAKLSESWAVGGTGTREGENANNSKAHAERSKEEADRSTTAADRAAQYANIVAPGFYVDPDTMCLYKKSGVGVDFQVFNDNVLCWKIA